MKSALCMVTLAVLVLALGLYAIMKSPPVGEHCSPGVVLMRAMSDVVLYQDGSFSDNFDGNGPSFYLMVVQADGRIVYRKVTELQADMSAPGTLVSCQASVTSKVGF